jgi:hypothetical protein
LCPFFVKQFYFFSIILEIFPTLHSFLWVFVSYLLLGNTEKTQPNEICQNKSTKKEGSYLHFYWLSARHTDIRQILFCFVNLPCEETPENAIKSSWDRNEIGFFVKMLWLQCWHWDPKPSAADDRHDRWLLATDSEGAGQGAEGSGLGLGAGQGQGAGQWAEGELGGTQGAAATQKHTAADPIHAHTAWAERRTGARGRVPWHSSGDIPPPRGEVGASNPHWPPSR